MNRKKLKPYGIAVLLVVLYAIDIFWLSDFLGAWMGLLGTVVSEALLVVIAVGVFLIFRGRLRSIFPFKKPEAVKIAGTVVLWIGAYWGALLITMVIAYFFPQEVMGAGQGIQDVMVSAPVLLSLLVISLTPAICEEMAFRGALLSCFRSMKNRWAAIIIVSVIFGAFHGSIWRMVPTMLLGIAMGYLLFETENMFYNMLFHLINNAFPILLLAVLNALLKMTGTDLIQAAGTSAQMTELPLGSVALYVMYGGAAPLLIYLGNYLLHKGQPGYENGVFPREKKQTLILLIAVGIGMMVLGIFLLMFSVLVEGIA
ncbi:CPBP family intramembrane metalloprotease [Dorea acetigenes]|uniref:CPBP family intramembrane metalloprotease n=1 Tax=Dorea acetigenes TaxID=2981787 RepID=A0ABT2RM90_9FIRM|nr:type II CAAX endopeptidase family protein [Dorea acetigenes]MCU6686406.1 CPBP family intramembrane metalloprotease [Dorea acetigenes]SCI93585.1 CAAX amino terminal protease self-immunity [uncultured Clostridium sp.]